MDRSIPEHPIVEDHIERSYKWCTGKPPSPIFRRIYLNLVVIRRGVGAPDADNLVMKGSRRIKS